MLVIKIIFLLVGLAIIVYGIYNTCVPKRNLKQEWIDALRSGEYKQGCHYLYNEKNDTYCCLGVLEHAVFKTKNKQLDCSITSRTRELNSMINKRIYKINNNICSNLMQMNDNLSKTFNEIADFIEEYVTEKDLIKIENYGF